LTGSESSIGCSFLAVGVRHIRQMPDPPFLAKPNMAGERIDVFRRSWSLRKFACLRAAFKIR